MLFSVVYVCARVCCFFSSFSFFFLILNSVLACCMLFESFNDWGGRECHKYVPVLKGNGPKIAPPG